MHVPDIHLNVHDNTAIFLADRTRLCFNAVTLCLSST